MISWKCIRNLVTYTKILWGPLILHLCWISFLRTGVPTDLSQCMCSLFHEVRVTWFQLVRNSSISLLSASEQTCLTSPRLVSDKSYQLTFANGSPILVLSKLLLMLFISEYGKNHFHVKGFGVLYSPVLLRETHTWIPEKVVITSVLLFLNQHILLALHNQP